MVTFLISSDILKSHLPFGFACKSGENAGLLLFFFLVGRGTAEEKTFIRVGVGSLLPGSRVALSRSPCQSKRGLLGPLGPYKKV